MFLFSPESTQDEPYLQIKMSYKGQLVIDKKPISAVLKIEGVRMEENEATEPRMLRSAKEALIGSGIRVPEVLQEIPWTDGDGGYSAFFMEDVVGTQVLPIGGNAATIKAFLDVRDKYKKALVDSHVAAWVEKEGVLSERVPTQLTAWTELGKTVFPNHPLRKPEDAELIQKAAEVLRIGYKTVEPEFMHGHLSHRDVVTLGKDIVLFSNLYWSYRAPFYDMVFPYHWYMLELAGQPGVTEDTLQQQDVLWKNEFANRLASATPEEQRLFKLARIERFAAALAIDAFLASPDGTNASCAYITDFFREELASLLS